MVDQPAAQLLLGLKAPRYGAGSKKPSFGGTWLVTVSGPPAVGRGSIAVTGSGVVTTPSRSRPRASWLLMLGRSQWPLAIIASLPL